MTHVSKKAPIAGDLYLCFAGNGSTLKRRTFPSHDVGFVKLNTPCLYRIPFGEAGQYIAYDLREGYHCTQPVMHTPTMREAALSASSQVEFPDRKKGPHHYPGVFTSFNNFDSTWDDEWDKLHSSYPWKEVGLNLLHSDAGKKPCERKNFAECAGYTGLNADTNAAYITARPSVLTSTNYDKVNRMCIATRLIRILLARHNLSMPVHIEAERNSEFALGLCRDFQLSEHTDFNGEQVSSNIFEFLTDAALVIPLKGVPVDINGNVIGETMQVRWHLDECNCPVVPLVFVLYKHIWFDEYKCWIRVSSIFTFRKAISDYYLRRDRASFFCSQLVDFYKFNRERHDVSPPPSPTFSNMHDCVPSIPSFNKLSGFHSCFATPVVWFMQKYPDRLTVEKVSELLVPIGFSRGPSLFYKIVSKWSRSSLLGFDGGSYPNKTGSDNLALEYIHATVSLGGVNAGVAPRHQPKVNGSFLLSQVMDMCVAVRAAIESTYTDPPPTYPELREILAAAPYFGDLGAQHIIAAAACAGILRFSAEYLYQADICDGTSAFNCLTKSYGVTERTVNSAYQKAAAILSVPPYVLEEVGCRLAKECRRTKKDESSVMFQPDLYQKLVRVTIGYNVQFPGQMCFSVVDKELICYSEELLSRRGETRRVQHNISFHQLQRSLSCPWEKLNKVVREIPTSPTSTICEGV